MDSVDRDARVCANRATLSFVMLRTALFVATLIASSACDRGGREAAAIPRDPLPSRRDLGPYPVIVPLDWRAINAAGQPEGIPTLPGTTVHRILIRGATLLTEPTRADAELPEAVLVEAVEDFGPITDASLATFAEERLATVARAGFAPRLTERRILRCQLSTEPVGKFVIARSLPLDQRLEVYYLVRDRRNVWRIGYLIRPSDEARWRAWFEEIESETPSP
jgi:hypothetical protein